VRVNAFLSELIAENNSCNAKYSKLRKKGFAFKKLHPAAYRRRMQLFVLRRLAEA